MKNKFINKSLYMIKKHSPELFMIAGITGTVVSTVLACKATTKVKEIIDNKNKQMDDVHACLDEYSESDKPEYTEDDAKKDTTIIYTQTGVKLIKLYAPSAILGILSISSIIMGQRILNKRNASLMAAYAVVDKGFKSYRKNVVERFGEEVDKELRHNIKAKEIKTEITDKNGKTKTKKEIVNSIENPLEGISEYARFFDESSSQHTKDAEYNLMFLRRQQDYANEKLKAEGILFLNDVYDMLGITKTKAGQVVGWVYNEDEPNGDNYVDFGIYDISKERNRSFVNGSEYNILLDFNVDGIVYDKL